ncbi:MAG: class I SAM-dependent methyltransferase [Gemmataceae bacterium]
MPLVNLPLPPLEPGLPPDVRRFLREADERIDDFQVWSRVPAFVPCDFEGAYRVLRSLADSNLLRGMRFCEWGSGFGVAACLAALAGFDACGIEIDAELVRHARQLADDFEIDVEFVRGSFIPPGGEDHVFSAGQYAWFTTDADAAYEELDLDPDDMDVIFAYPWPDEEFVTTDLFLRYAGAGAVLVTYHGGDEFRIRRKVAGPRKTKRRSKP